MLHKLLFTNTAYIDYVPSTVRSLLVNSEMAKKCICYFGIIFGFHSGFVVKVTVVITFMTQRVIEDTNCANFLHVDAC